MGAEVVGGADYSIAQIIRSRRLLKAAEGWVAQRFSAAVSTFS